MSRKMFRIISTTALAGTFGGFVIQIFYCQRNCTGSILLFLRSDAKDWRRALKQSQNECIDNVVVLLIDCFFELGKYKLSYFHALFHSLIILLVAFHMFCKQTFRIKLLQHCISKIHYNMIETTSIKSVRQIEESMVAGRHVTDFSYGAKFCKYSWTT